MTARRTAAMLLAVVAATLAAPACGKRGAPEPPEPRGPMSPTDVVVRRIGPDLVVACTVPARRGPRPSQDPLLVELLRVEVPPGVETTGQADIFQRRGEIVRTVGGLDGLTEGERVFFRDPVRSGDGTTLEGWSVRYAVRIRDRRGRTSTLAASESIVPADVPKAPTDLSAEGVAGGIALRWSAPPDGATFRVYRATGDGPIGETPVSDRPIEDTVWVDTSVVLGNAYRYVVRAIGESEGPLQESASSPEASALAEDRFAPEAPRGLVAVQEGTSVRLFWNPGSERDLAGYRVERSVDGETWVRPEGGEVIEARFLDDDVHVGDRVLYRVVAFDGASPPNESEPSEPVVIVVAADPTAGKGP